jgi:phospho-N-acetylmuramoyl-pentapeptide-transferase
MTHAMFAACLAMLVTIAAGNPLLAELRRRKLGKGHDEDAPVEYASKVGTPTMGGVIFMAGIVVAALTFAVPRDPDTLVPLLAMLAAGVLGTFDDFQTLIGGDKIEAHAPWFWAVKWVFLLGIAAAVFLYLYLQLDFEHAVLPHYGAYSLGVLYVPVAVVVFLVATSGAAITDGMDGLMAGTSAIAFAAYGAIALAQGQQGLGAFAFIVSAAAAAFLWFNAYPAQVFMGDAGAQALSVGLVVVAFMTGWWLLLPVIGVVFVLEGASDVLQIGYYKLKGTRILRRAPIHYHFQLGGWPETVVVARFWLLGLLGAFAGVGLAVVE